MYKLRLMKTWKIMKSYRSINLLLCVGLLTMVLPNCRKEEKGADCPNTPSYQALTASAKEWFPYTGNRTLIYENATLQRDTLVLSNFFLGDDEVWNGDGCPTTRGEFLRGNISDKKSGDTIKVRIGNGEQVIFQKKTGSLLYYDTQKRLVDAGTSRRFESTVTLNNKTYTSVLVFECSSTDQCTSTSITKFYFSKTKGLVAYQRSGVLWTLR
jgi:hypothetical protein